ncbi:hypothetical protein SEPCBS119000_002392 [Sporothrix epigloea]|uniref:Xylanolytic transcriptional activator regulatory domain-containing protein n=1 Tax=Sporothrix epigloea TaxID=1892477 RepID=A0ABP0DFY2_9PEZI
MDSFPNPPVNGDSSRLGEPPDDEDSPSADDLPACCECLYVFKQKPGLKAGAVDTLSRRLDFLEKLFLDGAGNKKPHLAFLDLDIDQLRSQLPSPFTPGLATAMGHRASDAPAGESAASTNGAPAPPESPSRRSRTARTHSRKRRRFSNYPTDREGTGNESGSGRQDSISNSSGPRRRQFLFLDDPPYDGRRRRRHHYRQSAGDSGVEENDGNEEDGESGDDNNDDDNDSNAASDASLSSLDHAWIPPLPALPLLKAIVEAHFQTVHHWVPILHSTRFRAALTNARDRRRHAVLIHAMVAMSIKYVDFAAFNLTSRQVARQIRLSRRAVQLNALDGLSFINTQALIFLAFDYMGSGLITKAWPIVATLTRLAVFLQLTVERDDASARPTPLVQPVALFDGPRDWTEAEERRRIFWGIFFLDRILSISAGWQPSLAGSDVRRRLPCSGGFWAREESVTTPYYALWDGRTGEMGGKLTGSMAAAPVNGTAAYDSLHDYYYGNAHHPTTSPAMRRDGMTPSVAAGAAATAGKSSVSAANTNKLGAVAYCIEATEHLTLVTAFFARQPPSLSPPGETTTTDGTSSGVSLEDRAAMNAWLTRFKELDLRLVHWKMDLPPQWADWHVSLKIDPNLTLCHLSHLTSMVLLHQHIAYPPPQWSSHIRPVLPSVSSAAICEQAVADIVAISQKYLRYVGGLVCGQFAFCLFVAARFTLVHGRLGKSASTGASASNMPTFPSTSAISADDTPADFVALLESLDNISVRWRGYCIPDNEDTGQTLAENSGGDAQRSSRPKRRSQPLDLAAQYASRLRSLHQKATGIGALSGVPVATTEELTALLSTSSMDGLVDLKSSSRTTTNESFEAVNSVAAPSTTSPLALSSSAASHLRSPSVIHGGGVEMANILQNPIPATAAAGRTPAITPMTALESMHSVISPSNRPDGSIVGYGSIRGGPVSATVSNVRTMPETPTAAVHVFNMDMSAQQHSLQQNPLHHLGQHPTLPQDPRHQHQHGQEAQHMHQQQQQERERQQHQHQHQQHQQRQQQFGIDDEDEFAAMSHLLMGNQFLDMDRVLISNDTSFLLR